MVCDDEDEDSVLKVVVDSVVDSVVESVVVVVVVVVLEDGARPEEILTEDTATGFSEVE